MELVATGDCCFLFGLSQSYYFADVAGEVNGTTQQWFNAQYIALDWSGIQGQSIAPFTNTIALLTPSNNYNFQSSAADVDYITNNVPREINF